MGELNKEAVSLYTIQYAIMHLGPQKKKLALRTKIVSK